MPEPNTVDQLGRPSGRLGGVWKIRWLTLRDGALYLNNGERESTHSTKFSLITPFATSAIIKTTAYTPATKSIHPVPSDQVVVLTGHSIDRVRLVLMIRALSASAMSDLMRLLGPHGLVSKPFGDYAKAEKAWRDGLVVRAREVALFAVKAPNRGPVPRRPTAPDDRYEGPDTFPLDDTIVETSILSRTRSLNLPVHRGNSLDESSASSDSNYGTHSGRPSVDSAFGKAQAFDDGKMDRLFDLMSLYEPDQPERLLL